MATIREQEIVLALILLLLGTASLLTACATPVMTSEKSVSPTIPHKPVARPSPDVIRQMLIDNPMTFSDVFTRLSKVTVDAMVRALPEQSSDEKTFKNSVLVSDDQETTRTHVLALAAAEATARRARFVNALEPSVLGNLALEFVALQSERDIVCDQRTPRVHNIGQQSVLTFEPKPADGRNSHGQRAVRIPVDGRDLDPRCVKVGVIITGTVPIRVWADNEDEAYGEYKINPPPIDRPDSFEVILRESFINRLHSGDQVTIQVTISQLAGRICGTSGERVVAFASRTFTLYSVDDYRTKVLNARIPTHDMRAFPLPDKEIEELFGPLIAEQFYVVRLSIRNTETEAKLVSTGMITASGRALVESRVANCAQPAYTLPVTIVPSSLQQTFKILDDEESSQPRSWIFRSLEFAGALTSAANAAFGASLVVSKAIGLLTGVGVPEGKKLIPDRWPGYKTNVVAFAMPDLIKVPAASVSDHKLLFFSKKNLQGMIADQSFFVDASGKIQDASRYRRVAGFWTQNASIPEVHVISLAFDNLDIRFEKVFDVGKLTLRQRVASLVTSLPQRISQVGSLDTEWAKGGRFDDTAVILENWKDLHTSLVADADGGSLKEVYVGAVGKLTEQDKRAFESDPAKPSDLSQLLDRLTAVVRAFDPTGNTEGYRKDLIANAVYGLNGLRGFQPKLNDLWRTLTAGPDPAETDVAAIETALENSRKAIDFYVNAAQLLANPDVKSQLATLRTSAKTVVTTEAAISAAADAERVKMAQAGDEAKSTFKKAAAVAKATLDRELTNLQKLRPNGTLNLMSSASWPQPTESK